MANPTVPSLDNASAEALAGTVHAGSGVTHIPSGVTSADDPTVLAWLKNVERKIFDHIAGSSQGRVIVVSGLNVGVFNMTYRIGATDYAYAGDASFAVTASETNHLYLDAAQTLKNSTSGWPGGDHIKLAKVVAGSGSITQIIDCRWCNFLTGIINAWATVAATQTVDMAGFGLTDLGAAELSTSTELTIATGVITPTGLRHTVDTQSDASFDDLTTITADAGKVGRLLILQCVNAGRVPTIRGSGNVSLVDYPDLRLDDTDKIVLLEQHTATDWRVLATNFNTLTTLVRDLDCAGYVINNIGGINVANATATIATGAITKPANAGEAVLRSEVTNNPDTLDTIFGGADDDWLMLRTGAAASGESITIDSGAGNIVLNGGDWVMSNDAQLLMLRRKSAVWYEMFRSPVSAEALTAAGHVVPYPINAFAAGALSDTQILLDMIVGTPFTMKYARGRVITAPISTSCIVDVLKNGGSVFAAQANAINIAAAANNDTSDEITVSFATDDRLTIIVDQASSAEDLTVSIEAYAPVVPQ